MEREARHGREQAYRALATLIQIEADRFRRQAAGGDRVRRRRRRTCDTALQLRPEFRALELSAEGRRSARDDRRLAVVAVALGVRQRAQVQLRQLRPRSLFVGGRRAARLGDLRRRRARRRSATWPTRRRRRAQAQAAVLADNVRDDLANARSLLETKRQAVSAATRSVELATRDDRARAHAIRGGHRHAGRSAAGAGRPGRRPAGAGAGPLRLAVADLTLRSTAGTFPPR